MSCTITKGLFDVTYAEHFGRLGYLNSGLLDDWKGIRQRIAAQDPTRDSQLLKAFSCVERHFSEIAAAYRCTYNPVLLSKDCQGLDILHGLCVEMSRRVRISSTERVFDEVRTSALQDRIDSKICSSLVGCMGAIKTLRRALGNDDTCLTSVGHAYGQALVTLNVDLMSVTHRLYNLLDVTLHNPSL